MGAAAWLGWGGAPELDLSAPRLAPPQVLHVKRAMSCCSFCTEGLDPRNRCTTSDQFAAIRDGSDLELEYQRVGGCVLDIEDELARRSRARRFAEPPTRERRGWLARLTRRSK